MSSSTGNRTCGNRNDPHRPTASAITARVGFETVRFKENRIFQMHKSLFLGHLPEPSGPRYWPSLGAVAILTLRAVRGWIGTAMRRRRANAKAKRARAAVLTMSNHKRRDFGTRRGEVVLPSAQLQPFWRQGS
jgi:hypothetical protein